MGSRDFNIGDRVRFAPNPRFPAKTIDAVVIRLRNDSRLPSLRRTQFSRNFGMGWLDTKDDAGFERSVRPSRCMLTPGADK